jgi:hypothetical protein
MLPSQRRRSTRPSNGRRAASSGPATATTAARAEPPPSSVNHRPHLRVSAHSFKVPALPSWPSSYLYEKTRGRRRGALQGSSAANQEPENVLLLLTVELLQCCRLHANVATTTRAGATAATPSCGQLHDTKHRRVCPPGAHQDSSALKIRLPFLPP